MQKNKLWFTLVELIVVITILAILWTIAFISFQWYTQNSRDSKRIADINSLKTSLEITSLNTWKYPLPDNYYPTTYSWANVWNQWTIWEKVVTNLREIIKIPVDPLSDIEYTYSVLNTNLEYEIWTIMESDNPIVLLNKTFADTNITSKAYITWNYNWILAKVSTWTTTYVLAVPSIISSEVWDILDIITQKKLVYNNYWVLPASYINWPYINDFPDWDIVNVSSIIVYSWDTNDLDDSDEQISLINKLQEAYSWTIIQDSAQVNEIFTIDENQKETISQNIIKRNINNKIDITAQNNSPTINTAFVSTWDTTKSWDTNNFQVKIPLIETWNYDFVVDWWDWTSDTITEYNQDLSYNYNKSLLSYIIPESNAATWPWPSSLEWITHTYTSTWVYDVTINWTIEWFSFNDSWDATKIIDVKNWGTLKFWNGWWYFAWCANLTGFSANDTPDLSTTTNMQWAFAGTDNFNWDINEWDVSNVNSMEAMFLFADSFNKNINSWNVSKVEDMSFMFYWAYAFDQDLNNWDVSKVTTMENMFYHAEAFSWDVTTWDVSKVENMDYMFRQTLLDQDISGWVVDNVTDYGGFYWQTLESWTDEEKPAKFIELEGEGEGIPF